MGLTAVLQQTVIKSSSPRSMSFLSSGFIAETRNRSCRRAGTTIRSTLLRKLSSSTTTTTTATNISAKKSLALSVYFKHPDFDMKDYEILSRATAFLLSVDPKYEVDTDDPYSHLEKTEMDRKIKELRRKYDYSPAYGKGNVSDMGWLEFVPKEVRPNVHVICSSHVVSPFLWRDYYPQDWLSHIRQEHCTYSLDIIDHEKPGGEVLGKFALYNEPIHHPEGRDLSLMHLKDEESTLELIKKQGVEVLYLRDLKKIYKKNEALYFEGFEVSEPDAANVEKYNDGSSSDSSNNNQSETKKEQNEQEDARIFMPYKEHGKLAFHTNDRFFATTPKPLPEGLCGAPVLDSDNDCCGVVEGIVPLNHDNKNIAGSAAFIPSFVMKAFIDYGERMMIQQMMPKDLYQEIVKVKATNTIGGGSMKLNPEDEKAMNSSVPDHDDEYPAGTPSDLEGLIEAKKEKLKQEYSKEEYEAIMWNLEREQKEVLEIMDKEGGDLETIMQRVRAQTLATRDAVLEEYEKGNLPSLDEPDTHGGDDTMIVVDEKDIKDAKKE